MRERRFLVSPEDYQDARAVIRGEELHHLSKVLRLRVGTQVSVFDGRGRGHLGVIDQLDASQAAIVLEAADDHAAEPALNMTLMLGLLHGERMDWAVEKATELGVSAIIPVLSARGMVKARTGAAHGKWERLERWKRIALSAAKQSGRLVVPEISPARRFDELISEDAGPETARAIFHAGGAGPAPPDPHPERAWILIGPEGGWSPEELAAAVETGWSVTDLGRRTLRAETAAAVAVALIDRWAE
jgi:16S rRNA (uracil1498-N3)-methyltransferase